MVERNDEPKYPIEAISMLKADHRTVNDLFAQYESAADCRTKHLIAKQVFTELELHAQLEENVFYPAYEARTGKNGTQLVADSRLEHEKVKELMLEMQGLDLAALQDLDIAGGLDPIDEVTGHRRAQRASHHEVDPPRVGGQVDHRLSG